MKNNQSPHHTIHEHLAGEHKWNHTGQISLIFIFTITLILDLLIFQVSIPLQDLIPILIRLIVGIPVIILAYFLLRRSIKTIFNQEQKEPKIIKNGIYSRVRHPIYLAPIIMYLGIILISLSILSIAIWILIIFFYYSMARYEESLIIEKFGKEYKDYMKDVPMFIPKLKK